MSIVGTRPPLISETNLYEPHHKATVGNRNCIMCSILFYTGTIECGTESDPFFLW